MKSKLAVLRGIEDWDSREKWSSAESRAQEIQAAIEESAKDATTSVAAYNIFAANVQKLLDYVSFIEREASTIDPVAHENVRAGLEDWATSLTEWTADQVRAVVARLQA